MKYTAIIEIPKNCDRRVHKSIETGEFTDFGPTIEVIPINEGRMPASYGFVKDTLNASEGDEVDVIIYSDKNYKTQDELEINILGMIVREDGDHKIIATDLDSSISSIEDIPENKWKLIKDFFGYKYKITSIRGKNEALIYLESTSVERINIK